MISSKTPLFLPNTKTLQRVCKAISVLDAIICQEWESRYYSYNCQWNIDEEFCEMRNAEGSQILILFQKEACVINGYSPEYKEPKKSRLTQNLPSVFDEFIFGEPVATIGTTFCIWNIDNEWKTGQLNKADDGSEELLSIFDGKPESYISWASDYFEGYYKENGILIDVVREIYEGKTLTKDMIFAIVDKIEDWDLLISDLAEIDYPYHFE